MIYLNYWIHVQQQPSGKNINKIRPFNRKNEDPNNTNYYQLLNNIT